MLERSRFVHEHVNSVMLAFFSYHRLFKEFLTGWCSCLLHILFQIGILRSDAFVFPRYNKVVKLAKKRGSDNANLLILLSLIVGPDDLPKWVSAAHTRRFSAF